MTIFKRRGATMKKKYTQKSPSDDYFLPNEEGEIFKVMGDLLMESVSPKPFDSSASISDYAVMDAANVAMVVPRTVRAAKLLRRYLESDHEVQKIPRIIYSDKAGGSVYSSEYVRKIVAILSVHEDTFALQTGREWPLMGQNHDFRIILAQRTTDEDGNPFDWVPFAQMPEVRAPDPDLEAIKADLAAAKESEDEKAAEDAREVKDAAQLPERTEDDE
jgi:hypothetical protein